MLKIEFNLSQLEERAAQVGASADQIPFSLATAMNTAVDKTRSYLIETTWPSHVQARNRSFIAASLTTKGARASKNTLVVELYDKLDHGNLQLHAKGGVRTPQGGSNLAIGVAVSRTSHGVPVSQKPRNLKNSFRKGDAIFQYVGRGKNRRIKLMYILKARAKIPKDVPFYEDFASTMRTELSAAIPAAVAKAMATRRR